MKPIQKNWKPSIEALKILKHAEIDEKFIIDALPEFILYWSERNTASDVYKRQSEGFQSFFILVGFCTMEIKF